MTTGTVLYASGEDLQNFTVTYSYSCPHCEHMVQDDLYELHVLLCKVVKP